MCITLCKGTVWRDKATPNWYTCLHAVLRPCICTIEYRTTYWAFPYFSNALLHMRKAKWIVQVSVFIRCFSVNHSSY